MSVTRQLFDMPQEVARLPRDDRGYPIPAFASIIGGKPDFTLVDTEFLAKAMKEKLCWICAGKLGKRMWFVTGPMCTITGISAEPPMHRGCATFSVKNCPFMTRPLAKRADMSGKPHTKPAGFMIDRNPGVAAMCEAKDYSVKIDHHGHPLFRMGDFVNITWWREGRPATGQEVLDSIETGLPSLYGMTEGDIMATAELTELIEAYMDTTLRRWLPKLTSEVTPLTTHQ